MDFVKNLIIVFLVTVCLIVRYIDMIIIRFIPVFLVRAQFQSQEVDLMLNIALEIFASSSSSSK